MQWIIQTNFFKPETIERLTQALDRLSIPYHLATIPTGKLCLDPVLSGEAYERIYVCGALKMAQIAKQQGWTPGSLFNSQFAVDVWQQHLGDELLNADAICKAWSQLSFEQGQTVFVRPLEDNKAFDGMLIDVEKWQAMQHMPQYQHLNDLLVIQATPKVIYAEYRCFVVGSRVVTASLYKRGGQPYISDDVEDDVLIYAQQIISRWLPAVAVVMDIALTDQGYKLIEFNNIQSASFYAADVMAYVAAIDDYFSNSFRW